MSGVLFSTIYSRFTAAPANQFYTATAGRLEYGVARPEWDSDYAVIQGVDSVQADPFRETIDDVYFQINLFSATRTGCWSLVGKCLSLFDRASITPSGYNPTTIRRVSQIHPIWNEDDQLYQATIEFQCKLRTT